MNSISPEYLGNLSLENINTKEATTSIEEYTKALQSNARTKAVADKLAEIEAKKLKNQVEITEWEERYNKADYGSILRQSATEAIDVLKKKNKELENQAEMYKKIGIEAVKSGDIGVSPTTNVAGSGPSTNVPNTKYSSLVRKQQEELLSFLKDKGFEIAQAEIDVMADGNDKKLAQMKLDHEKELALFEKQKQDRLSKAIDNQQSLFASDPNNKDKTFDSSNVKLSSEEESAFDSAETAIRKRQLSEEAALYKEVLDQYQTYVEHRLSVQQKYQKDRDILAKQGASEEKVAELEMKESEALSAIDMQFASRSIEFESWMNSIADFSLNQLISTLQEAETALELGKLNSSVKGTDGGELLELRAKVEALKNQLKAEIINNKTDSNSAKSNRSIKEWQNLYKTLDKVNNSFAEVGNSIGGIVGESVKAAGQIATSTMQGIDGMVMLANWSVKATEMTAKGVAASIQTVEKASVILAVIGAALQVAIKIASLFSKQDKETAKYEKLKNTYSSLIDVWDDLIEKKKEYLNLSTGSEAKKSEEEILEILRKQEEASRSLAEERLKVKNGGHSMDYRMWQGSYKFNGQNWKDVSGEISNSLGIDFNGMLDFTNMSSEQLLWIKENYSGLWATMDTEFRNHLENIINNGDEVQNVIKTAAESITQISFDTLYDNFKSILTNMDSSAQEFADDFENMMQNAIISTMIDSEFKNKIEKWYETFKKAGADGDLTDEEVNDLKKGWDEMTQDALDRREQLKEIMGWGNDVSKSQSASSGGFQTMSQDTGNELNGRFTALQIIGEEIKKQVMTQTDIQQQTLNHIIKLAVCPEYMSEVRDINLEMNDKMASIEKNCRYLGELPIQTGLLRDLLKKF